MTRPTIAELAEEERQRNPGPIYLPSHDLYAVSENDETFKRIKSRKNWRNIRRGVPFDADGTDRRCYNTLEEALRANYRDHQWEMIEEQEREEREAREKRRSVVTDGQQ